MDKGNGCSFSAVTSTAIISSVIFVITLILVRVLFVIYCSSRPMSRRAQKPVSTLIILGSGGHTAEMLDLLAVLQKDRFYPRFYIAAATDNMSLQKAELLENSLAAEKGTPITNAGKFMKIYRSREVGQSYITSIWTTLVAMILCNGPGTCIPICAIAFVFKVLGIRWSSIFYVESIARVRRLSLSGLLLYKLRIADQLFVQWPRLQQQYPRAIYVGRLINYFLHVYKKSLVRVMTWIGDLRVETVAGLSDWSNGGYLQRHSDAQVRVDLRDIIGRCFTALWGSGSTREGRGDSHHQRRDSSLATHGGRGDVAS
uniref:UDP-N-acetylglucosamine transferase subunit ALG14 n=1 Tax=Arachis ipaensis TaxID=130454 RepID=N1NF28_ARAIP|nr:putative oligosaccharide biosynthesis protein [Arachis ipaensis]